MRQPIRLRRDHAESDALRGLADLLGEAVVTREAGRRLFRGDGAVLSEAAPAAVVLPGDEHELMEAVRYCHHHGLEMVPRGGATSLRGGAVGRAESVVIATTRLNRIIEVDRRDRLVRAQAGATLTNIAAAAGAAGLCLSVAPAGRSPATLGGGIAKNSQGRVGPAAGAVAGLVEELRLVTSRGDLVEIRADGSVCGGYDLAGLIAGSEGAFGIISQATLRLGPALAAARLVVARFDDADAAFAAAEGVALLGLGTVSVEVIGGALWDGQSAGLGDWSRAGSETFVLADFAGYGAQVADDAEAVRDLLSDGARGAIEETADDLVRRRILGLRDLGLARLAKGRIAGVSDIVVPAGEVRAVMGQVREIAERHHLSCIDIVRPADGAIESLFLAADTDEQNGERVRAAIADAVALAGEAGGLASGAYGAGVLKAAAAGYGGLDRPAFQMQQLVKAVFDDDGLMNPGKVLVAVDA